MAQAIEKGNKSASWYFFAPSNLPGLDVCVCGTHSSSYTRFPPEWCWAMPSGRIRRTAQTICCCLRRKKGSVTEKKSFFSNRHRARVGPGKGWVKNFACFCARNFCIKHCGWDELYVDECLECFWDSSNTTRLAQIEILLQPKNFMHGLSNCYVASRELVDFVFINCYWLRTAPNASASFGISLTLVVARAALHVDMMFQVPNNDVPPNGRLTCLVLTWKLSLMG